MLESNNNNDDEDSVIIIDEEDLKPDIGKVNSTINEVLNFESYIIHQIIIINYLTLFKNYYINKNFHF